MNKVNHPINIHGGEIELINRKNFAILALYLWETDIPKEKFDMSHYCYSEDKESEVDLRQALEEYKNDCGTSACALGHGPIAGIKPRITSSWSGYCRDNFVSDNSQVWEFCFGPKWPDCPKFAAQRIAYMLVNDCIMGNILLQDGEIYREAVESYFDKYFYPNWYIVEDIANQK